MKAALATASLTLTLLSASCQRPDSPSAEETLQTITTKGGIEMVLIPAGTFTMGCRDGPKDASAVHQVTIASFWMDRCETTQADYERLGFPNPSHFKGPDLPVEQINWPQAATYCNARSQAEGLTACYDEATAACNFAADGYRLPTEAEWEYACRAGKPTDYSFGNDVRELDLYAWFADNSSKKTHPVGRKKPNRWACTTCTATWPNGATTSIVRTTIKPVRQRIRTDLPTASSTFSAEGRGTPAPTACARADVRASSPASPMRAFRATRSAFAVSARRPDARGDAQRPRASGHLAAEGHHERRETIRRRNGI